jgi:hypothetical protein
MADPRSNFHQAASLEVLVEGKAHTSHVGPEMNGERAGEESGDGTEKPRLIPSSPNPLVTSDCVMPSM